MKKHYSLRAARFCLSIICFGAVAAGLSMNAHAQIIVDGSLDAGYGGALAVQTINTGFGDSTVGDGTSTGGIRTTVSPGDAQARYMQSRTWSAPLATKTWSGSTPW